MMRVETVSGVLYYGDVFFGTEFVRVVPVQILVYSKEANGYMELENFPKELFIPIQRVEVIAQIEEQPQTETEVVSDEELQQAIENEELAEEAEEELEEDNGVNPNIN
jgi:hypothetical protein